MCRVPIASPEFWLAFGLGARCSSGADTDVTFTRDVAR
jgi:hypothetical protein